MSEDSQREAMSYTGALSDIIGRHIPATDYKVKLEEGQVTVEAGAHRFSFAAVLIDNQGLGELDHALHEARRSGEDPVDELAVQLGYLTEGEDT